MIKTNKIFSKKIFMGFTALITAIVMMTSCFAFAANSSDEQSSGMDTYTKTAVDVLRHFGFIPDYYDYNTNLVELASRADFASAAAKIVGKTTYSGDAMYFYDVPKTHWAYNEICSLTQMGVISGSDEKLFSPDEKIRKEEAYKILLSLMGYKSQCEADGGYPYGYTKKANRIKLLKNVTSDSEYVTLKDMFALLYNAMNIDIAEITEIKGEDAKYTVTEGVTLMSVYHDIYNETGVVTGAEYASLNGETLAKEDDVTIDGESYKSDIKLYDSLGEEIEFYYHKDDSKNEKRVLFATLTGNSDSLDIVADNDVTFDKISFKLKYFDSSEKEKQIDLDRGITVIYNGSVVSEKLDEVFSRPRYEAKFVKNDSGAYYAAVVKEYDNIVADKIDPKSKTVYDKVNPNKNIVLDSTKYDMMSIKMLGTTDIVFDSIKEGDVLSVYKSLDGSNVRVSVNAEQISGNIDTVKSVDNGRYIKIGTMDYYMPNYAGGDDIKPGEGVVLYLDYKGEVAYVSSTSKADFGAYLIKTAKEYLDENVQIKMFTEGGKMQILKTADSVKIDGIRYKDADAAFKALDNLPCLALLKTDKDGNIKEIDTVKYNFEYESEDSLHLNVSKSSNRYKWTGTLGEKAVLSSTTKVFHLPSDVLNAEDKDFYVGTRSSLRDDTLVTSETYKIAKRSGYDDYVIVTGYDMGNTVASTMPIVVDTVSEVMNSEGDVVECLEGFQGSSEVKVNAANGFSFLEKGVKHGMMVKVDKDSVGDVIAVTIQYEHKNQPTLSFPKGDSNINSWYALTMGYVTDIVDGVVTIGAQPGGYDRVNTTSNIPVVVVDSSLPKDDIKVGTINDAETFYNVGSNCSMIVMYTRFVAPQLYVIYK